MKNTDINRISAIVLAAGQSKRMGQNKLLMPFRGRTMLSSALDLVAGLDFGERILVTSKDTAQQATIPESFVTLINESPENGQASSLKLGLTAANLNYYMFFLADMPLLDQNTVLKIISEIDGEKIIVPEIAGIPANPVIFPQKYRRELFNIKGDKGGRGLIAEYKAECKTVAFENAEVFTDIDTVAEYNWRVGHGTIHG